MKITAKQYAQTLYEITDGKSKPEVEKTIVNFARYIQKERKLKLAGKIIEQFEKIYNHEQGIVEAEVITRERIDDTLEKKIKHFVKEKYQAKEIIVKNVIDQNIRGGIIIKIGDEVMDGSVAGKLNSLKKILVQ